MKEEIQSFDARKVTTDIRDQAEVLLKENASSFDPANAKRGSAAAAPLAAWVKANVKFSYVLEKIGPLEKEQNQLKKYDILNECVCLNVMSKYNCLNKLPSTRLLVSMVLCLRWLQVFNWHSVILWYILTSANVWLPISTLNWLFVQLHLKCLCLWNVSHIIRFLFLCKTCLSLWFAL